MPGPTRSILVSYAVGKSRHLSESQRAMVGARVKERYVKLAKERQKEHRGTAPGRGKTLPANLPEVTPGDARDQAGKAVGVSSPMFTLAPPLIYVPVCKSPRDFMFTFGPIGYQRVEKVGECPLLVAKHEPELEGPLSLPQGRLAAD